MRMIDRRSDRHTEEVIDQVIDKIIRRFDEPLSTHRGQGSDERTLKRFDIDS